MEHHLSLLGPAFRLGVLVIILSFGATYVCPDMLFDDLVPGVSFALGHGAEVALFVEFHTEKVPTFLEELVFFLQRVHCRLGDEDFDDDLTSISLFEQFEPAFLGDTFAGEGILEAFAFEKTLFLAMGDFEELHIATFSFNVQIILSFSSIAYFS
ncbi:MAG TPA: hypothetical protein P5056_03280 [Candidatus Paceibacterota bacterium]|nr:hypothetical protein [Candidatus Paceibacterota bacterium]